MPRDLDEGFIARAVLPAGEAGRIGVLQVIPRLEAGGAELGALQVATRLAELGHISLIASEGGRMVGAFEAAGAEHITLPVAAKNPLVMMENARRIAAIVRERGIDVVHARSRAPAWSALRAARAAGAAFVTTYHSDYSANGALKRFYNSSMVRGDRVIAVSGAIAHSIAAQYPWADDHTVIVHRGVDPARFDPDALDPARVAAIRAEWGVPEGMPVVLVAARVSARKGHPAAIGAVARARALGAPDFMLVCAGDDHQSKTAYRAELDAQAVREGVADRVRFVGHVSDMPAAYAAAALSLNVASAEGFPRVALEAQAMRTPVVITDHGPGREAVPAPPDVPAAEAHGYRVPFDDPDAVARAIAAHFEKPPEERASMGARGSQRVRGRFTIDRLTARTLAVYREAIALDRERG